VVITLLAVGAATAAVVTWSAYANRETTRTTLNNVPEVGAGAGHTGMSNEYRGIGKSK